MSIAIPLQLLQRQHVNNYLYNNISLCIFCSRYFEEISTHWTELQYRVDVMLETLDSEGLSDNLELNALCFGMSIVDHF